MPIDTPKVALDNPFKDLIDSYNKLAVHPYDDIRKKDYRSQAEGWYMDSADFALHFGTDKGAFPRAYYMIRAHLMSNGLRTDQFSISTHFPDPKTFDPTIWVFKVDKKLPNRAETEAAAKSKGFMSPPITPVVSRPQVQYVQ